MTQFVGLDLNATRARAVSGPSTGYLRTVVLDSDCGDFPLAVNLELRRPRFGTVALQACRRLPHAVCLDFLPYLGTDKQWGSGRRRYNAEQLLGLVIDQIRPALTDLSGLALTLPTYLSQAQKASVATLVKKSKLPIVGWATSSLAAVASARTVRPWYGLTMVLDVDEHALTWTAATVDEPPAPRQCRILVEQAAPSLGLRAWRERILDGIADRSIRQSRRDLRESSQAEQMLYDQLDGAMENAYRGQVAKLSIQTPQWCQDVALVPAELQGFCATMVRQSTQGIREVLLAGKFERMPEVIVTTSTAARLPGLLAALQQQVGVHTRIVTLPPDGVVRAGQELATMWYDGSLSRGPLDARMPLRRSPKSGLKGLKPDARSQQTKLPVRTKKPARAEDDFSVTLDD